MVAAATPTLAAVTWVSVFSNPIGDGADALIEIFEKNDKIQTLLGLEEGVQILDLSNKQMDPGQAKILAAEIRLRRFTAAVTKVDLRGNNFDSASKDALRSAAPQGCEVMFD